MKGVCVGGVGGRGGALLPYLFWSTLTISTAWTLSLQKSPIMDLPWVIRSMTLRKIEFPHWRIFPTQSILSCVRLSCPVTLNKSWWVRREWIRFFSRFYWCPGSHDDVSIFHQSYVKCKAANRPFVCAGQRKFYSAINKRRTQRCQAAEEAAKSLWPYLKGELVARTKKISKNK